MINKKELREKAKTIEPIIRIGKNGLTEEQVKEIKMMLKKRKLIKIKMLASFTKTKDNKKIAVEIAEKTDSNLIDQVGFVVVLYRR